MTAPRKPTAAEAWRALEQMADDDDAEREMERILALSDAQLDRELAEAGIDPAEARARGEAIARAVAERAPVAEPHALPDRPRRRVSGWTLLVAAAVAAVVFAMWRRSPHADVDRDTPSPRLSAADRARALRAEARDDCAAARWDACVRALDGARALDPASDAAPEVQGERRKAAEGLGAAQPPVPPSAWGDEKPRMNGTR